MSAPHRAKQHSVTATAECCWQAIAIASLGPDRASSGRLRCMERDSGSGTAAFNGCRSAVGADCALAEAWSSSACGLTADALGSTREGQASTRSILSRHLRNRKPPFSSSGDSCALGGTLSLTRLRTRGRMGVTGRKHPMLGVLCWCGTRQPPRGGSVRRNRTVKAVPLIVMEGTSRSVRPDAGWHALRIGGPSMTAADGCSLDTGRAVG
jgi:hypothetical protein